MAEIKISIEAARVNARLSQQELADKIGYSRMSVIAWENGKTIPRKSAVCMIANVCGIPFENISMPESLPKVSKVE